MTVVLHKEIRIFLLNDASNHVSTVNTSWQRPSWKVVWFCLFSCFRWFGVRILNNTNRKGSFITYFIHIHHYTATESTNFDDLNIAFPRSAPQCIAPVDTTWFWSVLILGVSISFVTNLTEDQLSDLFRPKLLKITLQYSCFSLTLMRDHARMCRFVTRDWQKMCGDPARAHGSVNTADSKDLSNYSINL